MQYVVAKTYYNKNIQNSQVQILSIIVVIEIWAYSNKIFKMHRLKYFLLLPLPRSKVGTMSEGRGMRRVTTFQSTTDHVVQPIASRLQT
jgi:hypothetical protein